MTELKHKRRNYLQTIALVNAAIWLMIIIVYLLWTNSPWAIIMIIGTFVYFALYFASVIIHRMVYDE